MTDVFRPKLPGHVPLKDTMPEPGPLIFGKFSAEKMPGGIIMREGSIIRMADISDEYSRNFPFAEMPSNPFGPRVSDDEPPPDPPSATPTPPRSDARWRALVSAQVIALEAAFEDAVRESIANREFLARTMRDVLDQSEVDVYDDNGYYSPQPFAALQAAIDALKRML
jgi:hypothetical protein